MTFTCRCIPLFLVLLLLGGCATSSAAPSIPNFEEVASGMEYREVYLTSPRKLVISQLRCDPKVVRFSLLLASDLNKNSRISQAAEIATKFGQQAVINCSYFDGADAVIGLHQRLGHTLNPDLAQGGVFGGLFFWNGARAGLKTRGEALPKDVPVLFQAGPRLVWDGEPIEGLETEALAARSGVAIDDQGRVILYVMSGTSRTTLAELPNILRESVNKGGVGAWRALNFDGGKSTQFALRTPKKDATLPGVVSVPAFLGVKAGRR